MFSLEACCFPRPHLSLRPGRVLRGLPIVLAIMLAGATASLAQSVRLPLPKNTKPTPVQKLNQEGVHAIEKRDYGKAKKLFYKAYLIDPNDPFTLNNLGYVSELEGELDRAQRFYALAAEHPSEAVIVKATDKGVIGKPVDKVAGNNPDERVAVNRLNVQAITLLEKDRAPEADLVLQKALKIDPNNPFTLNNLGYTKEKEGELEQAIHFYSKAAAAGSDERIVVSMNKKWRGQPINSVAGDNAKKAERALQHENEQDVDAKVARLNLRGVSAENRNERKLARELFQQAYKLDPNNAFTLNNMGYVSELDGDRETADFFYAKALEARKAKQRVALATRKEMEGQPLSTVANSNDLAIDSAQKADQELRRQQQKEPPALLLRDNSRVIEPSQPPAPMEDPASGPVGESLVAPPSRGIPVENGPVQDVIPPLEDSAQPDNVVPATPANPAPGAVENGPVQDVMPPLPDDQQPK